MLEKNTLVFPNNYTQHILNNNPKGPGLAYNSEWIHTSNNPCCSNSFNAFVKSPRTTRINSSCTLASKD